MNKGDKVVCRNLPATLADSVHHNPINTNEGKQMLKTFQKENGGAWGVMRNGEVVVFGYATEQGAEGYALREYPDEEVVTTESED